MVRTVLSIDGMMCSMCEAHINDAIRHNFAVKSVTSSHRKGRAEILSEQAPDTEKLHKVIGETGYRILGIESSPYEKKHFSLFGRS